MQELIILRSGNANAFIRRPHHRIVSLHITNRCNYHCSYCVIKDKLDKAQWSKEVLLKNIDWIIKDGKATNIFFFGGEPLIHPNFILAVTKCKTEINCKLSTMTNGSASLDFFKRLYSIDPYFQTTISMHFEKLHLDQFLEKAFFLANQKCGTHFKIMMHPLYRDAIYKSAEKLIKIIDGTNSRISCAMIRFPEQKYNRFSPLYNKDDWDFYSFINKNMSKEKKIFVELADKNGQRYIIQDTYEMLLEAGLLEFQNIGCLINSWKCIFDVSGFARNHVCITRNKIYKKYGEPLFIDNPMQCPLMHCWCEVHMSVPKSLYTSDMPPYAGGESHKKERSVKIEVHDILVEKANNISRFWLNEQNYK